MEATNWIEQTRSEIRSCAAEEKNKLFSIVESIESKIAAEELSAAGGDLARDLSFLAIPALKKLNSGAIHTKNPEDLPLVDLTAISNFNFSHSCKSFVPIETKNHTIQRHLFDQPTLSEGALLNDFNVYKANVKREEIFNPKRHQVFGFKDTVFPVSTLLNTHNGYAMVADKNVAYEGMLLGHKSIDLIDYHFVASERKNKTTVDNLFVVPGYAKNGFYHFIINSLPALFLYKELDLDCDIVFPYFDVTRYSEMTTIISLLFDFLNISKDKIVDPHKVGSLHVKNAIAPQLFRPSQFVAERYREFAEFLGVDCALEARSDIYITRHGKGRRPIKNELEIEQALKCIGLKIVSFDNLSFKQQVATIMESRIIVSPHGAALANLIFGDSDKTLIEFNTKPWNICFANLSRLLGMNYFPINADLVDGVSYKALDASFHIDSKKIASVVRTVKDSLDA